MGDRSRRHESTGQSTGPRHARARAPDQISNVRATSVAGPEEALFQGLGAASLRGLLVLDTGGPVPIGLERQYSDLHRRVGIEEEVVPVRELVGGFAFHEQA